MNKKCCWIVVPFAVVVILAFAFSGCMSSNVASLFGGVLGAIATCVLGYLALWQNKQYKELAEQKDRKLEAYMHTPDLVLVEVLPFDVKNLQKIDIMLENEGKTSALRLIVVKQPVIQLKVTRILYINPNDGTILREYDSTSFKSAKRILEYIPCDSELCISIVVPVEYVGKTVKCSVDFEYKNTMNSTVKKTLSFVLSANRAKGTVLESNKAVLLEESANGTYDI